MRRLLAIDTSGPALSVAVAVGPELVACRLEPLVRGHAERLLPTSSLVMAEAGWRWPDLDLVVVTLGPGNFTGLRAGIAVARALCLTLGIPALGLGTLETVAEAAAARSTRPDLPLLAAMDARRDEFYAQTFAPDLVPRGPVELVRRQDLPGRVESPCRLAGDAAAALATQLQGVHEAVESGPDARYAARLAWRRLASGARPRRGTALRPLYIRPPDAKLSAGASLVAASS
ncbi:tRNA (adenosine(37)-N6)-threonylcarbamoyltransferase complex dimerization subunit type 1 TsaB [Benzoatithermus flavus]|uniref:tRNA (Adenosine(37)-N6)-threonylcarbamoyltransferase complex dimerization subunit type 1 TsaB n=1 Tax=Benzoatithermus flavus TaxID=3108223 RepID=A0ABU8XUS5_9PROT